MKKLVLIAFIIHICSVSIYAQNTYTLHEAIAIALESNYGILIAKNEAQIASNNSSFGNAGFMPHVSLNAGEQYSNNNTYQVFADNRGTINRPGVASTTMNANVGLNWTLFDGFKMFASREKLQQFEAIGQATLKQNIESTLSSVIIAYSDIARLKQLIKSAEFAINISDERLSLAQMKLEIGNGSKLELLQAKVDRNALVSEIMLLKQNLGEAKNNFNALLSHEIDDEFEITDSIQLDYNPTFDELKEEAIATNTTLQMLESYRNVAKYSLRETQALRFPKLSLNSNYGITESKTEAGLVLTNNNKGFTVGLTASMPLFSGFNLNTQIKNAKLNLLNASLNYNNSKSQVEKNVLSSYRRLQNNLALLQMEIDNYSLARENLDIALIRFKLGNASALELKEAQKSYSESMGRLESAKHNSKVSETELKRLNGKLLE